MGVWFHQRSDGLSGWLGSTKTSTSIRTTSTCISPQILSGLTIPWSGAFASIHERLDIELDFMNQKARNGSSGHFNAENSRRLLDLIDEVAELRLALEKVGTSLTVAPEYQRVLDGAKIWLVDSGGSPIPEGFTPVLVEKCDALFGLADAALELADHSKVTLTVVGEGSFAVVHKFVDPKYDITFARKKLKRDRRRA